MDVCCIYLNDGEPELLAITASLDDAMLWVKKNRQYILDHAYADLETIPESLNWIRDKFSTNRLFAFLETEGDGLYELSIETWPLIFYTDEEA